jgi:hypothetical protein
MPHSLLWALFVNSAAFMRRSGSAEKQSAGLQIFLTDATAGNSVSA